MFFPPLAEIKFLLRTLRIPAECFEKKGAEAPFDR